MEFKITPGEYYTRAGGFYVLTQSDQQVVAKISGRTPEERKANANAIAALPDVLKALALAEEFISGREDEFIFGPDGRPHLLHMIRAALKLALDGRAAV